MNNDKDLNQLLVEIFKNATLNYLAWLEKETNPSQETDEADKATSPQQ
jgi:hypothetical protein